MKRLSYLLSSAMFVSIILIQTGCKTDDPFVPADEMATFNLNVYAQVDDEDLLLDNIYQDPSSYRYQPNLLKIYLSNITLVKSDGTEELIEDVALLDWAGNNAGEPETISIKLEPGNYNGIRFWLGVDQTLNDLGPNDYEPAHPLSLFQGTYWTWNTGYRFVMLEGRIDTLPNGSGTIPSNSNFQIHLGTNFLYREVDLSNAQQNFELTAGNTTSYDLNLDINKMFTNGQETLKLIDQPYNHTTGDTATAMKYTVNLTKAFSLRE